MARIITDPQASFDEAKLALERWRDFAVRGERWDAVREWEELVDLELSGGQVEVDDDEEELGGKMRKGKKSRR